MQENYRLRPDREYRLVGGISRGASWALHIGVKNWIYFSAIGGHSLPVFYEDAYRVFNWLADIPDDQMPFLYLDHADSDQSAIKRSIRSLIGHLEELGIPYQFSTAPGVHDQAYWASRVEEYLAFYISNWQ
jgi:enterochelin esterase-like enzyme